MEQKDEEMLLLTFDEIITATNAEVVFDFKTTVGITSVSCDSRTCEKGSLFVPLRGLSQDGHIFCEKALQNGAVCFFVDKKFLKESADLENLQELSKKHSAICLCVENNLHAFQKCAHQYLKKFPNLLRIAVTGSSGKTTTKELLVSIIGQEYSVVFSKGNLNSETGLPISVFNIRAEHKVAIFEMGMNRVDEIKELASVFEPNIALITNIGTAHIGLLGSQEKIALEKKKIFSYFNHNCVGFVPKSEWSSFLQKDVQGKINIVDIDKESNVIFRNLKDLSLAGYEFEYSNEKVLFPLIGKHNLSNAILAILVAEHLNIKTSSIKKGLESVKPGFGRSQIVHSKVDYLFDAYNANPESMKASIEFLSTIDDSYFKVAILGSMRELGIFSSDAHKEIVEKVLNSNTNGVFLYGDEIVSVVTDEDKTKTQLYCFKTSQDKALADTLTKVIEGKKTFVLLKGSRGLELEKFIPVLEGAK